MTRVLLLFGFPRSGTTILGQVLGSYPGIDFLGEVMAIWSGLNRKCGCGVPLRTCSRWSNVLSELAAQCGDQDIDAYAARLQAMTERAGSLRALVRPQESESLQKYARELESFYAVAARGHQIVVDSSKRLRDLQALLMADVDLRIVRLVRDPRGCVHSRNRSRTKRLSRHPRPRIARQTNLLSLADGANWAATITAARLMVPGGVPVLDMRYEDFLSTPQHSSAEIIRFAGGAAEPSPFVSDARVLVAPGHVAWGNLNARGHGEIDLRLDDHWRQEMPLVPRVLVSSVTAPVRVMMGY